MATITCPLCGGERECSPDCDAVRLILTSDEIEDIRFALGKVAQRDRDMADAAMGALDRALVEQADRFERLARKVTHQLTPGE